METITVIVASYGDRDYWDGLAQRALDSIAYQTRQPDEVIRLHGTSLDQARNTAASQAKSDLLCFLDCDDELEVNYIQAMTEPGIFPVEMRYPKVRYISESLVNKSYMPDPVILPRRSLDRGNFMVIGTVIPREIFLRAEGFRDIRAYEDWDLWIRCWMLGAEPRLIPGAIYRAYRRKGSRNIIKDPAIVSAQVINYNKEWQAKMKAEGKL